MARHWLNLILFAAASGVTWLSATIPAIAQPTLTESKNPSERQVTNRPGGHILTNVNVWSPDGKWIVYDTRSDPAGERFDGRTIEIVNVETGEVREVYRSQNGAHCGVATFSPAANKVVFILGPENPSDDWQYGPSRRQGVVVDIDRPQHAVALDARDMAPPFTPGALRGGTHVHVFDSAGEWVSFTYDDEVLSRLGASKGSSHDVNQRNIGVSAPIRPVQAPSTHPRNHDGSHFSVLVTCTSNEPRPGSDEISRAFEDAWIGSNGYVRADGTRQQRALAFQGNVVLADDTTISEVFVVDLPEDVTLVGEGPLEGTSTTRSAPPRGTQQRRLTFTATRSHPGIQGPRHWLRSSPDGERIAFLMRDDNGVAQIWTVSPSGGEPIQVTRLPFDIASAFTWSADGRLISFAADRSVFVVDTESGDSTRLTQRGEADLSPRPEACVFSPDGRRIAYVRTVADGSETSNQIFLVDVPR